MVAGAQPTDALDMGNDIVISNKFIQPIVQYIYGVGVLLPYGAQGDSSSLRNTLEAAQCGHPGCY